jgi:hypothetical protein
MSDCEYKYFTLTFSGTQLGTRFHGYSTSFERATGIAVKHNFWSTAAILDGGYPALVWRHKFVLYTEAGSIVGLEKDFINLADHVVGTPQALTIITSIGTVVTDFGDCYLDGTPNLDTPDLLLFQRAGFVSLNFIGNTKPV